MITVPHLIALQLSYFVYINSIVLAVIGNLFFAFDFEPVLTLHILDEFSFETAKRVNGSDIGYGIIYHKNLYEPEAKRVI